MCWNSPDCNTPITYDFTQRSTMVRDSMCWNSPDCNTPITYDFTQRSTWLETLCVGIALTAILQLLMILPKDQHGKGDSPINLGALNPEGY